MFIDFFKMLVHFCENPVVLAGFLLGFGIGGGGIGFFWWKSRRKEQTAEEILWQIIRICSGRVANPKELPKYITILRRKASHVKRQQSDLADRDRTIVDLHKRIDSMQAATPQIEEWEKLKRLLEGAERRIKDLESIENSLSRTRDTLVADNDRLKEKCGSLENQMSQLVSEMQNSRVTDGVESGKLKADLARRTQDLFKASDELKLSQYELANERIG